MPVFAFTAGSLGDVLATIGLTSQVVQVLYDNRNVVEECATLTMEIQFLQRMLIFAEDALKRHESTPLGKPLVDFIRPEVEQCHSLLGELSARLESFRQAPSSSKISNYWQRIVWVASKESVSLTERLSGHRLKLTLILVSLNSIEPQCPEKSRLTDGQLQSNLLDTKRIKDNTIDILDPLGDTIPVPTLLCPSWECFHHVMKGCFTDRIGQGYVERGDYQIVRPESGQIIDRLTFAEAVKGGGVFEMSIIIKSQATKTNECPRCSRAHKHPPHEGSWMRCFWCSCFITVDYMTTSAMDDNFPSDMEIQPEVPSTEMDPNTLKKSDTPDTKLFRRITIMVPKVIIHNVQGESFTPAPPTLAAPLYPPIIQHPPAPLPTAPSHIPPITQHPPVSLSLASFQSSHTPPITQHPPVPPSANDPSNSPPTTQHPPALGDPPDDLDIVWDLYDKEKAEKERLKQMYEILESGRKNWREEEEMMTMQLAEAKRTRARLAEELENERNARLKIEADFKCREVEARELSRSRRPELRQRVPPEMFIGGFNGPFPRLQ